MNLAKCTWSLIILLSGCQAAATETLTAPNGEIYSIERVAGFPTDHLPQNSDLKMADQDLAKYAESACTLDVPIAYAPQRCDIYVQSDPNGNLFGYAAVLQDQDGLSFATFTTLNPRKQIGSCYLGGKILGSGAGYSNQLRNAAVDFDGQVMFSAWEKEPGNFLVSQVEPNSSADENPNAALGVWYIEKKGNKLRISQERWNYCYRDSSVYVDEVFSRAITLEKLAKSS